MMKILIMMIVLLIFKCLYLLYINNFYYREILYLILPHLQYWDLYIFLYYYIVQ